MLRCPSRAALPCFHPLTDDYRRRMKLCEILPKLRVFVNQVTPRREIYGSLWPYLRRQLPEPFILLRGPSSYGKTVLAGALLDLATRLGHTVRYVDIGLDPAVDFVPVLERIWGGPPAAAPQSPLFDPLPLRPPEKWVNKFRDRSRTTDLGVYAEFRQELAVISANRSLTIVLDNFRIKNISGAVFWYMWENLFLHVGRDLSNMNLVVVLDDDAYQRYDVENHLTRHPHLRAHRLVKLLALPPENFATLLKEYMYFRSDDPRKALVNPLVAKFIDHFAGQEPAPISMAQLESRTREFAAAMRVNLCHLSDLRS
jgi:hypothetical protein